MPPAPFTASTARSIPFFEAIPNGAAAPVSDPNAPIRISSVCCCPRRMNPGTANVGTESNKKRRLLRWLARFHPLMPITASDHAPKQPLQASICFFLRGGKFLLRGGKFFLADRQFFDFGLSPNKDPHTLLQKAGDRIHALVEALLH